MDRRYRVPMVGKRFGRWTVIKPVPTPPYHVQQTVWYLCRCDCGTEREVSGGSLRNGDSRSCGCFRNELSRQRIKERMERKEKKNE